MSGEFFIARGDASELLELAEEAFHEVVRLVAVSIIVPWCVAIRARRDNGKGALGLDMLDQRIGIIALVGDYRGPPARFFEQRRGLGDVGVFAAGEREGEGVAERIDEAVDLGAESATRAAQSLWVLFF